MVRTVASKPQTTISSRYTTSHAFAHEYDLEGTILGTGLSGDVVLAIGKATGEKHAVKTYHKDQLSKDELADVRRELDIHMAMDHPHVAKMDMVFEADEEVHMVMEYLEGGTVFDQIHAGRQYDEDSLAETLSQMLLSVEYLHRQSIVHLDLKPENFVYTSKDSDHLKLIDFGFAARWNQKNTMSRQCGTTDFIAPEVLRRSYGTQADMWSIGVIAYFLLVGRMPFRGEDRSATLKNILRGKAEPFPQHLANSHLACDFVKQLLVTNPKRRMTAAMALEHSFIRDRKMRLANRDAALANNKCMAHIDTELLLKSKLTNLPDCEVSFDSGKKHDADCGHTTPIRRRKRDAILQCFRGPHGWRLMRDSV